MDKTGSSQKGKVKITWSSNFAYAVGLIASDGCLTTGRKTITLTSKDKEQIDNFKRCLCIRCKIGKTISGYNKNRSHRIQFTDSEFYLFLKRIGITPAKSISLSKIDIPDVYFMDFIRGYFDGDGYIHSYYDKRWKSSYMFYIGLCSGSKKFILWLQKKVYKKLLISGHITKSENSTCYQLKYAKKESLQLIEKMYYSPRIVCLKRKYLKIKGILDIVHSKQKILLKK